MKLLSLLSDIILESDNKKKFLGQFNFDGDKIKLFASPHQYGDRFGDMRFFEIRNYYNEISLKSDYSEKNTRIGVPNSTVRGIFTSKFEQIKNGFKKNPNSFKIRFVKHNQDNQYEEFFDYTEFVLARSKDGKTYTIVTSAYSQYGDFLKRMGKDSEQDPKVLIERFDLLFTVYL